MIISFVDCLEKWGCVEIGLVIADLVYQTVKKAYCKNINWVQKE